MNKLTLAMIVTLMLVSSCKSDGSEPRNGGTARPVETRGCTSGAPTEQDADPFEEIGLAIELEGVDDLESVADELVLQVFFETGDDGFVPVEWNAEEEEFQFLAPFYPAWDEGGIATVQLSGEEFACPPEAIEIEPLERAPGAFEEAVKKQIEFAELQATDLGGDPESMRNLEFEGLPIMLYPTAIGLAILDAEDNPNALLAVAARDAPVADEFDPEALELIDAIFGELDVARSIDEAIDDHRTVPPVPDDLLWTTTLRSSTRRQPLDCAATIVDAVYPEFTSARTLSALMQRGNIARKQLNNRVRRGLETALSLAPTLKSVPPVAAAMKLVSVLLYAQKRLYEFHANAYPSVLFNPRVTIDTPVFEEDWDADLDGPAQYEDYLVDAQSQEWKIGTALIEDIIGIIEGKLTGKAEERVKGATSEAFDEDVRDEIAKRSTDQAKKVLEPVKKKLADTLGDAAGCDVPPQTWTNINLENPLWHDLIPFGVVKKSDAAERSYEPREVGTGSLRLRAKASSFPPAENAMSSQIDADVEVREIAIQLDPEADIVAPGSTIEITAIVRNAKDRDVLFEVLRGPATIMETSEGTGRMTENPTADLIVDQNITSEERILVIARSEASRGLCAEQACLNRTGTGLYGSQLDLRISPQAKCLSSDDPPFEFTADIIGRDNEEDVVWSNTDGSNTGVVTPSSRGKGTYTITARYEEELMVNGMPTSYTAEDTARLSIDECDCEWNVIIRGPLGGVWGQVNSVAAAAHGDSLNISMYEEMRRFSGNIMAVSTWTPKGEGTFDAYFGGEIYVDDNLFDRYVSTEPGTMRVESYNGTRATVSFSGRTFVLGSAFAEELVYLDVEARAETFINDTDNLFTFINQCGGEIFSDGSQFGF